MRAPQARHAFEAHCYALFDGRAEDDGGEELGRLLNELRDAQIADLMEESRAREHERLSGFVG